MASLRGRILKAPTFGGGCLLTMYSETGTEIKSELSKTILSWAQSSSEGRTAVAEIRNSLLKVILVGFTFGLNDASQSLAEDMSLLGDYMDTAIQEAGNFADLKSKTDQLLKDLYADVVVDIK